MIPLTNQSFYEYAWAARSQVIEGMIANGGGGLYEILDNFCAFDFSHRLVVERTRRKPDETGVRRRYLTGRVSFELIPDRNDANKIGQYIQGQYERMAIIADLIDADTDAIIELGCGYGINLFRLMRLLKDQKFRWFGAEYTESGRSLCAKLADLDGSEPMDVPFIDHAAPDLGFMADVEKPLVFTCHSIEQVSIIPNNYFSILARAAPGVRGVHLEPFGFQADPSAPNSPTHRNFMHDQGWNLNFFSCLKLAEEKGDIRIEHVEIEKYDTTPNNPTSLAVWISTV